MKNGIPALQRNGFEESPFKGMRYGKLNANIYAYDLCRLASNSRLEYITVYISKGDSWINVFLNVFWLEPHLDSLKALKNLDGMQFHLPPNSISMMRLRIDDFKGMPLFRTMAHKIKPFYSEKGFHKRVEELSRLLELDLNNIDSFITRWYELYVPMVTNWEGEKVEENK
ncbi:hypothetical protein HQN83_10430 [Pedobacter sp. LMG 31643]|nr:hypothetical protein [Pedobacter foliorum]